MIPWPPNGLEPDTNDDPWVCSAESAANDHDYTVKVETASTEPDEKERLREEHRRECQQAFRRPKKRQKRQGRGRPPAGKWADRPPKRRSTDPGRRHRGRR